jgi:hypothetical protein
MKTKSFQAYLDKRLNKAEIAELEKLAKLEFEIMLLTTNQSKKIK